MESKIEKKIFNLMNAYAIASKLPEGNPNEAKLKSSEMAMCVNSLVDLFNTQPQAEEIDNTKLVMPPSAYDQAEKEGFNMKNKVKSKLLPQDTPEELTDKKKGIDNGVDREDTPEELIKRKLKEITTSERVGFLYAVGDDDLLANELYDYIQQLLSERERELLEDIVNKNTYEQGVGYGDIASDVIKRLDKLNKKK